MDKLTQLGKTEQENNDDKIFFKDVENLSLIIKQEEVCFELSEVEMMGREGYFHPIEKVSMIEKEDYSEPADVLIKQEKYDFQLIDQNTPKQKNDLLGQVRHQSLLIPEIYEENVPSSKLEDGGVMGDEEEDLYEDDFQKDETEIDYIIWSPNEVEPDPLALYPDSKPVFNRTKKITNFLPLRTDLQTLLALESDSKKYRLLQAEREAPSHKAQDMDIKKEESQHLSRSLLISNTTSISYNKFISFSPPGLEHQKESFKIEIPPPTASMEETITPPTKSKRGRLKNWCLYCKSFILNFGRHIIRKHQSEIEVQNILSLLPNSKERKDMISVLRNKGNNFHLQNEKCQKENKRLKVTDDMCFDPCIFCLGIYVKKQLCKHQKMCLQNSNNTRSSLSVEENLLMKDLHVDEQLRVTVFPRMRADMASLVAKEDPLICEFGSQHLKKGIGRKYIVSITSKLMRKLGKLLIEIKKVEPDKSFVQVLKPQYYDLIVQSTKTLAKYISKPNVVSSYSMSICRLLKCCCKIALTSMLNRDIYTETDRDLIKVMLGLFNSNWKNDIDLEDDCTSENNANKYTVKSTIRRKILEPWTETQKCIIKKYFKQNILTRRSPRKFECENLKRINPGVFNNKSWLKIKGYIQSLYVKSKKDFLPLITNSTNNIERNVFERKKRILVPWTDEQKDIVKDYFKEHIRTKRPPKKFECEDLLERYPNVFDNKSWRKIKVYIHNIYSKR